MNSRWMPACLLALALAPLGYAQTKVSPDDEVESHRKRAFAAWKGRNFKSAAAHYEKALIACKKSDGENSLRMATACEDLGACYQELHQYAKAEPLLKQCLRLREKLREKNQPDIAVARNNLGLLYRDMKRLPEAAAHLDRSLEIKEAQRPRNESSIAVTLMVLALVRQDLGQYDEAEKLHLRILSFLRNRDKNDPRIFVTMHNLADVYKEKKKLAEAEDLYKKCLAAWEKAGEPYQASVATALFNLGSVYQERRDFVNAEDYYTRSLRIRERLDQDAPNVAKTLNYLAGVLIAKENPALKKAEQFYRRSLRILVARLGKDHPDVSQTHNQLGMLLARQGKSDEASNHFASARQISRQHVSHVLPGLPESEQEKYWETRERKDFERALAIQLALPPTQPDSLVSTRHQAITSRAASWLLNGKALGQEARARSAVLNRDARDPVIGKFATQLREVRGELTFLALSRPKPGEESSRQKQLAELEKQEQAMSQKLQLAGSAAVAPADWYELTAVSKRLPLGAVLIDVARIHGFDFKGVIGDSRRAERYVAWITSGDGEVIAVDLGLAKDIDNAVGKVRRALEGSAKLVKREGEATAELALREPLDRLSKLVMGKLQPHIGQVKRWIISPDGSLWMVPWEIFLIEGGKYAVEKHTFSYVLSGRDLLPARSSFPGKVGPPLVVADPDYDLDVKANPELGRGAFHVERLPFANAEAKAIDKPLRAYTKAAPVQLLRGKALEASVKAAKNPRVLVLTTHGFFLSQDDAAKLKLGTANPLSRCGLLLAGCNLATKSASANEGVLTGLEVLGLDLRGCEMVVLSACETGLGDLRKSEGVSGLRQAFMLAGAESVVSSLWKVPDESSARLMAYFFDNLAKGKGKALALREAGLKLIDLRREDGAAAHPLFWAAFTVTGR